MDKSVFKKIENYMISCMSDSAHDKEHIYRVLYIALNIAKCEEKEDNIQNINMDILITACLLHDVGREEQFKNNVCHAQHGSKMAKDFLHTLNYFNNDDIETISQCILTHRYRTNYKPKTIEAKILFDSDKIDCSGALGIARTLLYNGQYNEPLYTLNEQGDVLTGEGDFYPSFFEEYKNKLSKIYSEFYTKKGAQIALKRKNNAIMFYENLLTEVLDTYENRLNVLVDLLD